MERPVVVIGGGIVGTAIAYELQRAGRETILVERDLQPQGASALSFASLSAFDEPQRDVYLLKSHGLVAWREWANHFGERLGVRFTGELRWAEAPYAARHLELMIERSLDRGYPVRYVSTQDLLRSEPAAKPNNVVVASLAPNDGQADPIKAIDVLRGAFAEAGGKFVVGRAGMIVGDDHISVQVRDDLIRASTVVVAAGAETAALFDRLGWEIPMDPSPGLLAMTTPTEPLLNGTVYVYPEAGLAFHLRQLADGRVVIGERAQDQVAHHPTLEHALSLLHQARKAFPALDAADVDYFTVEWRPMPRDQMPVVGPLPGLSSVYIATGHSGVTIAPALAQFIREEIIEGSEAEGLKALRPTRFSARQADLDRPSEDVFSLPESFFE